MTPDSDMALKVTFTDDPTDALSTAKRFLESEPVLHNLILSLLHERVANPEPGRYWIASSSDAVDDGVSGIVFQSPLTFDAVITPMGAETAAALVTAITKAGVDLPGIVGEASATARFAGSWASQRKCPARPSEGQRIYELIRLEEGPQVRGHLRTATAADADLVASWVTVFQSQTGQRAEEVQRTVDIRIAAGQYVLWEDGEPVSMAWASAPVCGVSRIGAVFTPPEKRNRGYAEACVRELSRSLAEQDVCCTLFTQLDNPTSNAIYHRIGYRPTAEALRYSFDYSAR